MSNIRKFSTGALWGLDTVCLGRGDSHSADCANAVGWPEIPFLATSGIPGDHLRACIVHTVREWPAVVAQIGPALQSLHNATVLALDPAEHI